MTRIAFAGDRQVAVDCLEFLVDEGVDIQALLTASGDRATHSRELREISGLAEEWVIAGTRFREPDSIAMIRDLDLDYIVGVHFPYIIPDEVLAIPRVGVTNLHPSLLPFNRGWHTPSWAILDETPAGVTLHFMDSGLDTGDIVAQVELEVRPYDTANSLYAKLLDLEVSLFRESWPLLAGGDPPRRPQSKDAGTNHNRADLGTDAVRRIDLDSAEPAADILRRLRALTTNDPGEAAYFEHDGKRYRVQVTVAPDEAD